jgi:site-specific recombinase XerD
LKQHKDTRRIVELLSDEKKKLLDAVKPGTWAGARMMLIPALFIYTGMRVSELDSIAIEGIDYQQSRIKTHGKGDKYRCVPIGPDTAKVINRWINCPTTIRITHLRIAQHIAHRVSPGRSTWQWLSSQTGAVRLCGRNAQCNNILL